VVEPMTADAVNKYVGQRITEHRTAAGMSKSDLAARLGLSRPWVTLAESGQRTLPVVRLIAVATVFGAQPADFLPPVMPRG
jgi:transcriptional regulator with XRE-family HTH domain